jgi:hypothetical protein
MMLGDPDARSARLIIRLHWLGVNELNEQEH